MSTELIINASLPETRITLLENGEIQDLLIERASGKGIVGNIYKGRVTRVLPGMQAAFVDIGLEKAAFLYVDDVFVHSEVWEDEEEEEQEGLPKKKITMNTEDPGHETGSGEVVEGAAAHGDGEAGEAAETQHSHSETSAHSEGEGEAEETHGAREDHEGSHHHAEESSDESLDEDDVRGELHDEDFDHEHDAEHDHDSLADEDEDEEDEEDEDDQGPIEMGRDPGDDSESEGSDDQPHGTVSPEGSGSDSASPKRREARKTSEDRGDEGSEGGDSSEGSEGSEGSAERSEASEGSEDTGSSEGSEGQAGGAEGEEGTAARRRHRRGRRGGKFRRRDRGEKGDATVTPRVQVVGAPGPVIAGAPVVAGEPSEEYPESYQQQMADEGEAGSDRSAMSSATSGKEPVSEEAAAGRPESQGRTSEGSDRPKQAGSHKAEFNSQRSRDRRIKPRQGARPVRAQVNIQDLLKEGQEVLVQVAKDPISTKGARLTCHISLPGRHLVCMPTIDHVGVSRRIERDEERRRLREYVERYRPKNLGFIVRTASGKQQSEKRIKQDIEYLSRLWNEIREKAASVTAPALVYEDLNSVLRAIRDWVTEDIDKVVVDSRYHYNEIQRFVSHFMPSLKQKVELYHGDIPIFDAYNISPELSRALERKVWLKSGGYIVIDQAEALVAIDVNTGRYVGKKNLEDTILKTNLEAVQEIAYQLRLRNCGGIIILDFIDMEKEENKQRVYRALDEALKKDRARPTILKISELGLVEMTRKRTRDTMVRALCDSCTHCEGKGFIKSKQTVAYEALRELEREGIEKDVAKIMVQAHSDVIDILAIDERETLDMLERRYRKQIYLQAVADYHLEQFEVVGDKRDSRGQPIERGRESSRAASGEERGGERGGERGRRRERGRDRNRNDKDRDQNRDQNRERGRGRSSQQTQGPSQGPQQVAQIIANPTSDPQQPRQEIIININPAANSNGVVTEQTANPQKPAGDDFFDEEDRLAFVRAQAAQDAALAGLRGPSDASSGRGGGGRAHTGGPNGGGSNRSDRGGDRGGAGADRGERGGRRGRRGRRGGGKFRRAEPGETRPGFTPSAARPVPKDTSGGSAPAPQAAADTGTSEGGNGGGGGSDHSNPPV